MGTATILSETLFGRTSGAVLAVLFGHVGESFYLRQLSRRTGITLGPVQREIRQLVDAGLVTRERRLERKRSTVRIKFGRGLKIGSASTTPAKSNCSGRTPFR